MGVHPLHFNGVVADIAPTTVCGQPIMQHDWQTADGVSRDAIALAIADAEQRISQYLGFKLLPTFEADERHEFSRSGLVAGSVKMNYGHVVAGGIERRDVIQLNVPVVYSDDDADGYKETATVAVSTAFTDLNEFAMVMPGEGGAVEWEIRPIQVSVSGGVATLVARREQLVNPVVSSGFATGTRAVDGSDDAQFLLSVDIYRVWHDPSQQVQFLWEANSWGLCGCGMNYCQTCYLSAQFGCTTVRDYRLGLIAGTPATWNVSTSAYESAAFSVMRAPERGRFWYRAGYRNQRARKPMLEMDTRWESAVSKLAATLLERPICGCPNVENITRYWRDDLAVNSSDTTGGSTNRLSNRWLNNPLGTARGAIHAWRIIRNEAIGDAVVL